MDRASVELVTPVTSALDEVQPSASSSTIALPSTSPPASLSTSFLPIRVEQQQLTVPLLSSTPNTTFTPGYYSPSALPSPVPSPIYSLPAALNPLPPVEFLPGPPTPAPPRPLTPSPAVAFRRSKPDVLRHEVFAGAAKADPSRSKDVSAFRGSAATRNPRTARSKGGTITGRTNNQSGYKGVHPGVKRGGGGLDLRVNHPYPDFRLFSNKLKNVIK